MKFIVVGAFGEMKSQLKTIFHRMFTRCFQRTVFQSVHPADGSNITVTIIFQAQQTLADSIPFFNVLLGRVMQALKLVRIGRDNYNPRCAHAVPQHRMELWPGYVTAIDEYEGGLKLNINASHRVMRTDTVRDLM